MAGSWSAHGKCNMSSKLHMFDLKSTAHCSTPHHLYYSAVQPYTRTDVHFYGCRGVNGYQQSDAWIMLKIIKMCLNCTPFHQQQKLSGWLLGWGEHRLPVMLGWGEHRLPVVLGWDEHRLAIALGWGGHMLLCWVEVNTGSYSVGLRWTHASYSAGWA